MRGSREGQGQGEKGFMGGQSPVGLVVAIMVRDHASATILSGIQLTKPLRGRENSPFFTPFSTTTLNQCPPELTFSRADELITLFSGV